MVSKLRLKSCEYDLQRLFNEVIKHVDCSIVCGHRVELEQNKAYFGGFSTKQWPNSKHNELPSLGVDAAPYIAGRGIPWDDHSQFYFFAGFVLGTAKQMNIKIRSGADFNMNNDISDQGLIDLPHFELMI